MTLTLMQSRFKALIICVDKNLLIEEESLKNLENTCNAVFNS